MSELFISMIPGLLLALLPVLVTIAWQMVARRQDAARARRERLMQAFLNFKSEADFVVQLIGSANVHVRAVATPRNLPAIWVGVLQPFDLTRFSDNLIQHSILFSNAQNELMSLISQENNRDLVRAAAETTISMANGYFKTGDGSSVEQKGRKPKRVVGGTVEKRLDELTQRFDVLAAAMQSPSAWRIRGRWP